MKALQVIQSAYRCTVEEQDDPVVWFAQVLKAGEGDVDILLKGNAVNYGVVGQEATPLSFGSWTQTHPAKVDQDLKQSIEEQDLKVYAIAEDIKERGIPEGKFLGSIELVSRRDLPKLFDLYDQVWHW
jgi:hypothetical protein